MTASASFPKMSTGLYMLQQQQQQQQFYPHNNHHQRPNHHHHLHHPAHQHPAQVFNVAAAAASYTPPTAPQDFPFDVVVITVTCPVLARALEGKMHPLEETQQYQQQQNNNHSLHSPLTLEQRQHLNNMHHHNNNNNINNHNHYNNYSTTGASQHNSNSRLATTTSSHNHGSNVTQASPLQRLRQVYPHTLISVCCVDKKAANDDAEEKNSQPPTTEETAVVAMDPNVTRKTLQALRFVNEQRNKLPVVVPNSSSSSTKTATAFTEDTRKILILHADDEDDDGCLASCKSPLTFRLFEGKAWMPLPCLLSTPTTSCHASSQQPQLAGNKRHAAFSSYSYASSSASSLLGFGGEMVTPIKLWMRCLQTLFSWNSTTSTTTNKSTSRLDGCIAVLTTSPGDSLLVFPDIATAGDCDPKALSTILEDQDDDDNDDDLKDASTIFRFVLPQQQQQQPPLLPNDEENGDNNEITRSYKDSGLLLFCRDASKTLRNMAIAASGDGGRGSATTACEPTREPSRDQDEERLGVTTVTTTGAVSASSTNGDHPHVRTVPLHGLQLLSLRTNLDILHFYVQGTNRLHIGSNKTITAVPPQHQLPSNDICQRLGRQHRFAKRLNCMTVLGASFAEYTRALDDNKSNKNPHKIHPSAVIFHSFIRNKVPNNCDNGSSSKAVTCVGAGSLVEYSIIEVAASCISIGENCIVSGFRSSAADVRDGLELPAGIVLQQLPLQRFSDDSILLVLGVQDDTRTRTTLYGKPLQEFFRWTGITEDDLWSDDDHHGGGAGGTSSCSVSQRQTIGYAEIHPVITNESFLSLFAWLIPYCNGTFNTLQEAGPVAMASFENWKNSFRLPLTEIREEVNAMIVWNLRQHLVTDAIPERKRAYFREIRATLSDLSNLDLVEYKRYIMNTMNNNNRSSSSETNKKILFVDLQYAIDLYSSSGGEDLREVFAVLHLLDDVFREAHPKQLFHVCERACLVSSFFLRDLAHSIHDEKQHEPQKDDTDLKDTAMNTFSLLDVTSGHVPNNRNKNDEEARSTRRIVNACSSFLSHVRSRGFVAAPQGHSFVVDPSAFEKFVGIRDVLLRELASSSASSSSTSFAEFALIMKNMATSMEKNCLEGTVDTTNVPQQPRRPQQIAGLVARDTTDTGGANLNNHRMSYHRLDTAAAAGGKPGVDQDLGANDNLLSLTAAAAGQTLT